jgi:hypothetical protein
VAALSMILDGSLLLYFFVADIRVTLFSWTTMTQKMVLTLAADVVFIVLWILASIQVAGLTGTCVADNAKATSDGGSGFDCISLFATLLFGLLILYSITCFLRPFPNIFFFTNVIGQEFYLSSSLL